MEPPPLPLSQNLPLSPPQIIETITAVLTFDKASSSSLKSLTPFISYLTHGRSSNLRRERDPQAKRTDELPSPRFSSRCRGRETRYSGQD
ncbi:hypothetical protein LOK49_LG13G00816 [Camellia lanceoleosa]|uniref:Uncharacterized protein n=1 Tax=Camellia lanceoleosa TaxID=1840588 RepID=A0ACC0FK76_9ERIC|nr:hypothetical protein LOK49_LG13G00816 [Camellia lanceoleosa]